MTQPSEWTDGEYPTEAGLERVRSWPPPEDGNWTPLLVFLRSIWWAPEWGWHEEALVEGMEYRISTGGWSGNEELVGALRGNHLFWMFCWQSSRRGGHYTFQVRTR